MVKMSGLEPLFAAVGNLYLLLALVGIGLALWKGKTWPRKAIYATLVLTLFIAPILPNVYRQTEYRNKLAKAQALFDERCKTAGEKIYRIVEGVDGLLLVNGRERVNKSAQFDPNDPAGDDAYGIGYIESFLKGRVSDVQQTSTTISGAYRFVELVDVRDKRRYQYFGTPTPRPLSPDVVDLKITRREVALPTARYGVVWEDISKREDREAWIAGTSIKIVDLQTNEVMGQRIGYMMDRAQGNTSGERSPWAFAAYTACPSFPKLHGEYPHKRALTRNFAAKVIKPTGGE